MPGVPADAGGREHAAEEVVGGVDAGKRSHASGAAKKVVNAPARREQVRYMIERGMSERHALRYTPVPDRNGELRERIVTLAQ